MSLTPEQLATLRAAADRIIPADEHPSASQLGVIDFLNGLMIQEGLEAIYSEGLDGLERESQILHGSKFVDLAARDQDHLLSSLETGATRSLWSIAPQEFFELLARQTIEGFYADPGNGGNRDEAAWKMIGFRVTS